MSCRDMKGLLFLLDKRDKVVYVLEDSRIKGESTCRECILYDVYDGRKCTADNYIRCIEISEAMKIDKFSFNIIRLVRLGLFTSRILVKYEKIYLKREKPEYLHYRYS